MSHLPRTTLAAILVEQKKPLEIAEITLPEALDVGVESELVVALPRCPQQGAHLQLHDATTCTYTSGDRLTIRSLYRL
jgi:hypothetical protein